MGTPPPPGGEGAEQSRACGRSSWSSSAGAAPCSPLARSSAASSSVTGVPCSQGQGFSSNCLHSCCLDHGCEHIFPPSFPPTPPLGWNFQMHLCIAFNCVLHNESFFCLSESGVGGGSLRIEKCHNSPLDKVNRGCCRSRGWLFQAFSLLLLGIFPRTYWRQKVSHFPPKYNPRV